MLGWTLRTCFNSLNMMLTITLKLLIEPFVILFSTKTGYRDIRLGGLQVQLREYHRISLGGRRGQTGGGKTGADGEVPADRPRHPQPLGHNSGENPFSLFPPQAKRFRL